MFRRKIFDIQGLATEAEKEFFSNVIAISASDDIFPSVLRLLLKRRLTEERTITFQQYKLNERIQLSNDKIIIKACNEFTETHENFNRLLEAEEFIKPIGETNIFVNKEASCAIIYVKNEDKYMQIVHALASIIPVLLPNIFEESNISLSQEETAVLRSLCRSNSGEFLAAISRAVEPYTEQISNINSLCAIKSLIRITRQNKENKCRDSIRNATEDEECAYVRYIEKHRLLERLKQEYEAVLNSSIGENMDDLMDFIKSRKDIRISCDNEGRLIIIVTALLDTYDMEQYKICANSLAKVVVDTFDFNAPQAKVRKFLDLLFSDEAEYAIRVCSNYYIVFDRNYVGSTRGYNYNKNISATRIANPHIDYYACIGGYRPLITDAIMKGDYIDALQLCVASAKSLNFCEINQTVGRFIKDLLVADKPCIENRNTGELITPFDLFSRIE